MIVHGMIVCSSFLISVCMFIVLIDLLISSATVIVRAGGAIWLNPVAMVLFCVCSVVIVVVFCTRVAWVCLVCLLLCREEGFFSVFLQLLRRGIWACMRYHCLCLFWGVWDRDYVSQLPCVRYYVFVKSSFKHTREECESKRAYVF